MLANDIVNAISKKAGEQKTDKASVYRRDRARIQ